MFKFEGNEHHVTIRPSAVKAAVHGVLLANGWEIHDSWRAIMSYKKDGLTLEFMYKSERFPYFGDRDADRARQATHVRVRFDDHSYHMVYRKISYQKFTFEWLDTVAAELSAKREIDLDIKTGIDAKYKHQNILSAKAQEIAKEVGMLGQIESDPSANPGEFLFTIYLERLSEAQVRDLINMYKNLKSFEPEKLDDEEPA